MSSPLTMQLFSKDVFDEAKGLEKEKEIKDDCTFALSDISSLRLDWWLLFGCVSD